MFITAVAFKVAVLGERPPLAHISNRRCPPKLRRLVRQCWESDPLRRPAAAEVAKELQTIMLEYLGEREVKAVRAGAVDRMLTGKVCGYTCRNRGGASMNGDAFDW